MLLKTWLILQEIIISVYSMKVENMKEKPIEFREKDSGLALYT